MSLLAKADQLEESLVYDLTQGEIEAATETEIKRTQEILEEVEGEEEAPKEQRKDDAPKLPLVSPGKEKASPATTKRKESHGRKLSHKKKKRVIETSSSEESDPSWMEKSETAEDEDEDRPLRRLKKSSKRKK